MNTLLLTTWKVVVGSVAQNALKLWSHLGTCFCVAIRRAQVWHFGIPQGVTYSIYSYTCVPDYPDFGCLSLQKWDILGGQDWFAIPQVTARAPGHFFCEFGVVEKGIFRGIKGIHIDKNMGTVNKQTSKQAWQPRCQVGDFPLPLRDATWFFHNKTPKLFFTEAGGFCCGSSVLPGGSGVHEDLVKSDAAAAVQSIPAYVEAANLFVALVPSLKHREILGWDKGMTKG